MAPSLKRPATTSPSGTIAKKYLRELKIIKLARPELNDATEPGQFILHPTPAQILPGQRPDAYA